MLGIWIPVDLKPGPAADKLLSEVREALMCASDSYSRSDPMGCDLAAMAETARLERREAKS
jgi:hypothetical protein